MFEIINNQVVKTDVVEYYTGVTSESILADIETIKNSISEFESIIKSLYSDLEIVQSLEKELTINKSKK